MPDVIGCEVWPFTGALRIAECSREGLGEHSRRHLAAEDEQRSHEAMPPEARRPYARRAVIEEAAARPSMPHHPPLGTAPKAG